MHNLKDLTLLLTSKALTLALHTLNLTFQLRRLAYSGNSSLPVIQFLMDHISISALRMYGCPSYGTSQNLWRVLYQQAVYLL